MHARTVNFGLITARARARLWDASGVGTLISALDGKLSMPVFLRNGRQRCAASII